jgi:hypothetical protein
VHLARLERDGLPSVLAYTPEPASHLHVADVLLTPVAYIELGVSEPRRRKFRYWLEVDRGTENAQTLRGKCVRYWKANQAWEVGEERRVRYYEIRFWVEPYSEPITHAYAVPDAVGITRRLGWAAWRCVD